MVYIPSETVLILEKPTTRVEVVKLLEVWVVVRRKERKEGWERKLMGRGRSSRAEREERTRETFTLFAHSLPLVPGLEGERAEAPVEMWNGGRVDSQLVAVLWSTSGWSIGGNDGSAGSAPESDSDMEEGNISNWL